jgi:Uma2 family endonuclease
MIQTLPELVTFDEFIDWYPENSEHRYELHNGEIVEIPKATGKHSKVAGFTALKVGTEIERLNLPYFIPKECVIKPMREESGMNQILLYLTNKPLETSRDGRNHQLSQWVHQSP